MIFVIKMNLIKHTGAFLLVWVHFDPRPGKFTPEIILPELCKPNVSAIVL